MAQNDVLASAMNLETMRSLAMFAGLPLTEDRLEEVRRRVEANRLALARLRALDVQGIEPDFTPTPGNP